MPISGSIADGQERNLDPKSVTVARLAGATAVGVLALVLLVAILVLSVAGPLSSRGPLGTFGPILSVAGLFLFCCLFGALVYFWPPLRYRHTSYRISEQGIRIRRGVPSSGRSIWRPWWSIPPEPSTPRCS